jgi:transcriptional regulator with XRE-family HTH domain
VSSGRACLSRNGHGAAARRHDQAKKGSVLPAFGERVRELRLTKNLTLQALAKKVRVTFTYLSKIENQKLSFGEFPSDALIVRLARALGADPDELLLLAEKIPDAIRTRVLQRPDVFRRMADLDNQGLDEVLAFLDRDDAPIRP